MQRTRIYNCHICVVEFFFLLILKDSNEFARICQILIGTLIPLYEIDLNLKNVFFTTCYAFSERENDCVLEQKGDFNAAIVMLI